MNNSLKQPRKVAGFVATRQFAHKPKVRRNAQRLRHLQSDQSLKSSPWDHVEAVSLKVDVPRVNWKGIIYLQQECEVYDPRPRLRKR